eukprot:CAMPEP_0168605806 /NCGR_PEP_ID=MMETSP0420-20121227/16195_1 /TAXON_ID=498008 /ORGANISM="Pessonella sp." /LENGTH=175 /DNA_ID=CAMNT_0008645351 /DNA_START=151 /DNA_END=675 /DNA_ORIENTATION=-
MENGKLIVKQAGGADNTSTTSSTNSLKRNRVNNNEPVTKRVAVMEQGKLVLKQPNNNNDDNNDSVKNYDNHDDYNDDDDAKWEKKTDHESSLPPLDADLENRMRELEFEVETQVGITAFMDDKGEAPRKAFQGVFKHRFRDFLVNELTPSGEIIELTDDTLPPIGNDESPTREEW